MKTTTNATRIKLTNRYQITQAKKLIMSQMQATGPVGFADVAHTLFEHHSDVLTSGHAKRLAADTLAALIREGRIEIEIDGAYGIADNYLPL